MNVHRVIVVLFAIGVVGILHAEPIDDLKACVAIREIKQRLACYDRVAPSVIAYDQGSKAAATAKGGDVDSKLAQDALSALKKMQSRVSVGISYRDYSPNLSEVKFAIENYLEKPTAKKHPELAAAFMKALDAYEVAGTVWKIKFQFDSQITLVIESAEMEKVLLDRYPKLELARLSVARKIAIDFALPVLWEYGSESTAQAAKLLEN